MARDFTGSTQYLSSGTDEPFPTASSHPWSFSCWVEPDSVTGSQACVWVGNITTVNHAYLGLEGNKVTCFTRDAASGNVNLNGTTVLSTGTVYQIGCSIERSYGAAVLNGTVEATDSTTDRYVKSVMDRIGIGARLDTAPGRYFNGRIWSVAMWQVRLSASDWAELGQGADPRTVRPDKLYHYWTLDGEELETEVTPGPTNTNTYTLTNTDSTVVSTPGGFPIRVRGGRFIPSFRSPVTSCLPYSIMEWCLPWEPAVPITLASQAGKQHALWSACSPVWGLGGGTRRIRRIAAFKKAKVRRGRRCR